MATTTGPARCATAGWVERNRHDLTTLIRYAHEQGLLARPLTVDELFAADTLAAVDAGQDAEPEPAPRAGRGQVPLR